MHAETAAPSAYCQCEKAPWVSLAMLDGYRRTGERIATCPDRQHCLHGAPIRNGVIADHWRNLPGPCPWVGMRVFASSTCLGCFGHPRVPERLVLAPRHLINHEITSVFCPGHYGDRTLVEVRDRRIAEHGRCPWGGALLVAG
ncbi:hypothetical protein [Nocardia carnea]|uniref:hypothetical protein n=1 Tax=Nocardia carnea TaxID=37328 RepID=UPI0024563A9B|nr:hypothetical protein [Nocardia carnea]